MNFAECGTFKSVTTDKGLPVINCVNFHQNTKMQKEKEEMEGRKKKRFCPAGIETDPAMLCSTSATRILSEIKSGRISDGTCEIIAAL